MAYQTEQKVCAITTWIKQQNLDNVNGTLRAGLDKKGASYKDKMKYFVNVLAKQVVKRYLVKPLPHIIMSPPIIHQLTNKGVGYIAKEPQELTQQRAYLKSRKDMLKEGTYLF
ncbi:hypothetical protein M3J09_009930 [Ascochyta lentis]